MAFMENPAPLATGRVENLRLSLLSTTRKIAKASFVFKQLVAALAAIDPAALVALGALVIREATR